MSQIEELKQRHAAACDLKQEVDRDAIAKHLVIFQKNIETNLQIEFIEDAGGIKQAARAASDARDARAVRDARDVWDARAAWDARDAWDAWAARDVWDARDARDVWDARAARDAWAARDARDARAARAARDAWDAWDTSWMAITAIGALSNKDTGLFSRWMPMLEAFEQGAYCLFWGNKSLAVTTIPEVRVDDRRRLHNADGAAFSWLKDIRDHYWHGVYVPDFVIEKQEQITVEKVESEQNTEVRRVMIERFIGGQSAYLQASGAQEIHKDDYGTLYRKRLAGDEDLVMVKVVNSTPEPTGEFRDYFLRVPPTFTRAKDAVAWTFEKNSDEYQPLIQT